MPSGFAAGDFWSAITGLDEYIPNGDKGSWIQNPCFRYAQKRLAYTLFGRGDSTGVASKREFFFLHYMGMIIRKMWQPLRLIISAL